MFIWHALLGSISSTNTIRHKKAWICSLLPSLEKTHSFPRITLFFPTAIASSCHTLQLQHPAEALKMYAGQCAHSMLLLTTLGCPSTGAPSYPLHKEDAKLRCEHRLSVLALTPVLTVSSRQGPTVHRRNWGQPQAQPCPLGWVLQSF